MSSFFNKYGIALPKPTQVARTKIRNLYEDGYPGAAARPSRRDDRPKILICTSAFPWFSPGYGYNIEGSTGCKDGDPGSGIPELVADHEWDMIDRGWRHHGPGPVTGLLGGGTPIHVGGGKPGGSGGTPTDAPCPDPSDMDPSGWSSDDCD
tara:strand:+ start:864 stop:1316 length:453 start_codon:yes stop_codon:yes gene_type:complete